MTITNQSATIVFANCAGAARGENCNPNKLGQHLNACLSQEESNRIVAVGLSEVIISQASNSAVHLPSFAGSAGTISLSEYNPALDDLCAFQMGFNHNDPKKYYLSHVNSRDHKDEEALKGKWRDSERVGGKVSERIADEFNSGRDVYQGTGALLFSECTSCEGLKLRPAGENPLSVTRDDPLAYKGNRDSEPRSAMVIRELKVADDLTVDLVFCQLETNKQDIRFGDKTAMASKPGVGHRKAQIDKLCSHLALGKQRPVILMGDFNARPGSVEIEYLCTFGFSQIFPLPDFNKPLPDLSKCEKDQSWSYSHLKHGILIDHAFVRGLDSGEWSCELKVIELPNEDDKQKRVSDHRPIALTIKRSG